MSRYLHSKYAGNHGDVLKHAVFISILQEVMVHHPEGIELYDTHAGVGEYYIQGNNESSSGIVKVMESVLHENKGGYGSAPIELVEKYAKLVKSFNDKNCRNSNQITNIEKYPGSPAIAQIFLRPQDSHYLWELHSDIFELLISFMRSEDAKMKCIDVGISHGDGYSGLLSHLSSFAVSTTTNGKKSIKQKKLVILIDPPNKHVDEYEQTRQTFEELLINYSQATIMLWLPILEDCPQSLKLINNLKDLILARTKIEPNTKQDVSWTLASLTVSQSGLLGSSMFVLNPPKSFNSDMGLVLPFLAKTLSKGCREFSLSSGP